MMSKRHKATLELLRQALDVNDALTAECNDLAIVNAILKTTVKRLEHRLHELSNLAVVYDANKRLNELRTMYPFKPVVDDEC